MANHKCRAMRQNRDVIATLQALKTLAAYQTSERALNGVNMVATPLPRRSTLTDTSVMLPPRDCKGKIIIIHHQDEDTETDGFKKASSL